MINWMEAQLPITTEPGYGEKQLPVTELVKLESLGGGAPGAMIVWFFSLEDEKANRNLESGLFKDEPTALSLKMFKRVKINVETITDDGLLKEYGKTPGFVILDPKGGVLGQLTGKKASSRGSFKSLLAKSWGKLFTMKQRDYLKQMTKILNRLDSIDGKLTVIKAKEARLAAKPNAGKSRALAKDKAVLEAEKAKIEGDEAEIKKNCSLKEEYVGSPEGAAEK